MICKNCGAEIKEDEKFCQNCGTKVAEPVVAEQVDIPEEHGEPTPEPQPVVTTKAEDYAASNVSAIVLLVVDIVTCLGGSVVPLILAIISLKKWGNARKLFADGNFAEAADEQKSAKKLRRIGWIVFAVVFVVGVIFGTLLGLAEFVPGLEDFMSEFGDIL